MKRIALPLIALLLVLAAGISFAQTMDNVTHFTALTTTDDVLVGDDLTVVGDATLVDLDVTSLDVGGGYGTTGLTVAATGNLQTDGSLTVGPSSGGAPVLAESGTQLKITATGGLAVYKDASTMIWQAVPGSDTNILGGEGSAATSSQGVAIGGGITNTVTSADYSTIAGGSENSITSGDYAFVGGGANNEASGSYAALTGGITNTVTGDYSTVTGGSANTASGDYSIITGGNENAAGDDYASVVGGDDNAALGPYSSVTGGKTNTASGDESTVAGGEANNATGNTSAVVGGMGNTASALGSLALAGAGNTASGVNSLAAGSATTASGDYAVALGRRAKAVYPGTFAWADSTNADFTSVITDSFNIRATGGAYFTSGSSYYLQLLTGNLKVGNGTPDVTLNGEDAYVEGTLEVDSAARFDSSLDVSSTLNAYATILDPAAGIAGALTINDTHLDIQSSVFDSTGDLTLGDTVNVTSTLNVDGALHAYVGVTHITTDTLVTAADRAGWFYLESTGTTTDTVTLPAAAAGLSFCFYNYDGDTYYLDPATGDQVHVLTNAAGDRVSNTTAGDSICLVAINDTYWIATQRTGTWSDAN